MQNKSASPTPDDAPHILVVDDDQRIRELLCRYLRDNGFRVTMACDAAAARTAMVGLAFDALIVDVTMPGETGLELAADIKSRLDVPILMLTARTEPEQRVQGLEIGVDDYVSKPVEPRELLIRINNILRYVDKSENVREEVHMGEFVFHIGRGELKRGDTPVKLTERERDLLREFAQRPGEAIPRHELSGSPNAGSDRAVDVQINRLRRKIEADPGNPVYLQTVRGKGYILHTE